MVKLKDWFFGSDDSYEQLPNGTPQQQQLHGNVINQANQLGQNGYQAGQNYQTNLLNPGNESYQNFAAPYLQQFEEEILPMISERYAGMGALSSSGFGQSVGGAAKGLQTGLAKLFEDLRMQAAGNLTNQYNQLTQTGLNYQPFNYVKKQGSAGMINPFLTGIATAAGGPLGGALGNSAATGISNIFK